MPAEHFEILGEYGFVRVPALPKCIIKMLVESLVLSHLNYALCVWGTSLNTDLVSRLCRLYNRAIQVTCGLKSLTMSPIADLPLGGYH